MIAKAVRVPPQCRAFPVIQRPLLSLAGVLFSWLCIASDTQAQLWSSALYDETWQPESGLLFESDKLIQDFSYAGYRSGEAPLPALAGPVFDVVADFGADASGTADSTLAIQAAIDAAESAGGGVVFLSAGTYRVAPQGAAAQALLIDAPNVVLRGEGKGQTFLLNAETNMRGKAIIQVTSSSPFWYWNSGTAYPVTSDLLTPTTQIPVGDSSPFAVGDWIMIRNQITTDWINEHNEPGWLGYENSLSGLAYCRQIKAIDATTHTLTIDVPTRYALKTRDNTRIYIRNNQLTGVGIEALSVGNVQHAGADWGEGDYSDVNKSAGQAHASYVIRFRNARDSWIRDVSTFQSSGNTSTCHLLSNGILLQECRSMTIARCEFQRPQYGGGGGNGYMYRLQHCNDCLVLDSEAEFSRHGFVLSHMGSSGNVFRNCIDRTTGKATGSTGSYNTSGKASDNHMQFSHSNLFDVCTADDSWWTAHYRPFGTGPKHRLTSAHTVYWNTRGLSSPLGVVVHSQQSRYGYVIGTRGSETDVKTDGTDSYKTDPVDHVEGKGLGDTLDPFSLSLDQRRRRLMLPKVDAGPDRDLFFPGYTLTLADAVSFGDSDGIPTGAQVTWTQLSGPGTAAFNDANFAAPSVVFPTAGIYELECRAIAAGGYEVDDFADSDRIVIVVHPSNVRNISLPAVDDAYTRGGSANENDNFGSADSLWMKSVGNVDFERQSFLKFDLAALVGKTVSVAMLQLSSLGQDIDATGDLHLVGDDSWNEATLTWANRPLTSDLLQSWTPATNFVQSFAVTPSVVQQSISDQAISFRLAITSQQNSSTVFRFASKEHSNASLQPRIDVRITEIALTFAEWIDQFSSIPLSQRTPSSDPDGDNNANIAEYFHSTDPSRSEGGAVSVGSDEAGLFLQFQLRSSFPPGARLSIEHSHDLPPMRWTVLPGVQIELMAETSVARTYRARLPAFITDAESGFFRLRYD